MCARSLSSENKIVSQIAPKGRHQLKMRLELVFEGCIWDYSLGNIYMSVGVAQSSQLFTNPMSSSFRTCYWVISDAVM